MKLVMNFVASKLLTMVIALHQMIANVADPGVNGPMTVPFFVGETIADHDIVT